MQERECLLPLTLRLILEDRMYIVLRKHKVPVNQLLNSHCLVCTIGHFAVPNKWTP